MSTVYATEPPTKGKVIFHTSMGQIEIELWPKEAPKAVRNFLQLCLDGYYDNCAVHRVVKDFILQTGDPTGTGQTSHSIYGAPFQDEFNPRLRFSHRGIVACANQNVPNTNGSQFFITLAACPQLDKSNTIFGKVVGDTIFNVLRMGELEVDEHDRPVYPPTISHTEIIWNPFDDMEQSEVTYHQKQADDADVEATKEQVKESAVFQSNKRRKQLLSFQDELEEDEDQDVGLRNHESDNGDQQQFRMVSAHDVLDDDRLAKGDGDKDQQMSKQGALEALERLKQKQSEKGKETEKRGGGSEQRGRGGGEKTQTRAGSGDGSGSGSEDLGSQDERDAGDFNSRMMQRAKDMKRRFEGDPQPPKPSQHDAKRHKEGTPSTPPPPNQETNKPKLLQQYKDTYNKYSALTRKPKDASRSRSALDQMKKFKASLAGAKPDPKGAPRNTEQGAGEGGKESWQEIPAAWRDRDVLTFDDDADEDLDIRRVKFVAKESVGGMKRNEGVDDYVYYDPLADKAKARAMQSMKKNEEYQKQWGQAGKKRRP